jgi:cell fate (sporulation/competence/biofilm development) regulator YmcA (YheA/YmcA/DUF963 family)
MSYPKEILKKAINTYLIDKLDDYKFSESSLKFTRKKDDLEFVFLFTGRKTNFENLLINFDFDYYIKSNKFNKWHKSNFPNIWFQERLHPENTLRKTKLNQEIYTLGSGYDFIKYDHKLIMEDFHNTLITYINPYFEANDNWSKIADNSNNIDKINALIMAEKLIEAREYCNKMIIEISEFQKTEEFLEKIKEYKNLSEEYEDFKSTFIIKYDYIIKKLE